MEIVFKKLFYGLGPVSEAAQEFGELFDHEIIDAVDAVKVKIRFKSEVKHEDRELVKNEFCNFVLGLMKK